LFCGRRAATDDPGEIERMAKTSTKRKSPGRVLARSDDSRQAQPTADAIALADANGQASTGETNKGWFKTGNKFWKKRSTHGPKPKFSDPEMLAAACEEYFDWAHDTPLEEPKPYAYAGNVKVEPIPKLRAMTVQGLCVFLDVSKSTWEHYRARPELEDVCARAESVIRTQKFEGAAANIFNARLISRDLGLGEGAREAWPPGPRVNYELLRDELVEAIAAAEKDEDS
jgi:hypothetical protein